MKKSIGARAVVYPTPVLVVGTYDSAGKANVMTAAWGGICCSSPPSIGISLRPSRYTYGNIVERRAFTISIPSAAHVREADYFGMVSGADEDKFTASGLTPVRSERVDAPYVAEFPFALECSLLKTVEIGVHVQFVGEIVGIQADASVLDEKGKLDVEKVAPILYAPENGAYYGLGPLLGKAFSLGKEIG